MIIYSIYKVVNRVNGKVYIGFTNNFKKRKTNHITASKNPASIFHRALRKYGIDQFEWVILYQSKEKDYTKKIMEQYFIEEHQSFLPKGYNTCQGGGGGLTSSKSIENMISNNPMFNKQTRQKVSDKIKELWSNNYQDYYNKIINEKSSEKKRMSKIGDKNPNYNNSNASSHLNIKNFVCIHCGITTTKGNIKRWHDDKCKSIKKFT